MRSSTKLTTVAVALAAVVLGSYPVRADLSGSVVSGPDRGILAGDFVVGSALPAGILAAATTQNTSPSGDFSAVTASRGLAPFGQASCSGAPVLGDGLFGSGSAGFSVDVSGYQPIEDTHDPIGHPPNPFPYRGFDRPGSPTDVADPISLPPNQFPDSGLDNPGSASDVAVIPAPGAALLGAMGLGLVGWMRKRIG